MTTAQQLHPQPGAPSPKSRSGCGTAVLVLGGVASLCGASAIVALIYFAVADALSSSEARDRLTAAIAKARDGDDPCEGARELRIAIDRDATVADGTDELAEAWSMLEVKEPECCQNRATTLRSSVETMNAAGVLSGPERVSGLTAALGGVDRYATMYPSVEDCRQVEVVWVYRTALRLEQELAVRGPDSWRTYREVQRLEGTDTELAALLFPAPRRTELAAICVAGGRGVADGRFSRQDWLAAAISYEDVLDCASHGPGLLSDRERAQIARQAAIARERGNRIQERRNREQRRAEAIGYEQQRREAIEAWNDPEVRDRVFNTMNCMGGCREEGNDLETCVSRCNE